MTGSNPTTDRSKLGTKRHILTDENGIPLSSIITSANIHDIKIIIDVIDNSVIKRRPSITSFTKNKARKQYQQHLCLDRAYHSKSVRQQIIKRGYIPHIPYKRKRGQKKEKMIVIWNHKKYSYAKNKRWL